MWRRAAPLFLLAWALAACGNSTQTVTGVLTEEGGPSVAVHVLVPGYIKLTGAHHTYLAIAGRRGGFSVRVVPGTYRVAARLANLGGVFDY